MIDLGQPHHLTLDHAIKWLENLRNDCDEELRRLKMLQVARAGEAERQKRFRLLSRDLLSENIDHAGVIRRLRSMGLSESDIDEAASIWRVQAARQRRKMRNQEILRRVLVNGESVTAVADEYGLSRAQVHRILKS